MKMSDLIKLGEENELFSFNDDKTYITYNTNQKQDNKKPWNETEEKVRAEVITKLVLTHEYPLDSIAIEVSVKLGDARKRADIIVYNTNKNKKKTNKAYIIIETKTAKDIEEARD